jgi:hypothetical protein
VCHTVDPDDQDQRLVDEAGDSFGRLLRVCMVVRRDGLSFIKCEDAGEGRETAEHTPVAIGEETEACLSG